MTQGARKPSRLVQALARWALTFGATGTIVGGSSLAPIVLDGRAATHRHSLLLLAGILLALAFVLAPFVRRTFGDPFERRAALAERTLLDEMRDNPQDASGTGAAPAVETSPAKSLALRLVTGAYLLFAAALLAILWVLQTR